MTVSPSARSTPRCYNTSPRRPDWNSMSGSTSKHTREGFDDSRIRTVSENALTLKFDQSSFETD